MTCGAGCRASRARGRPLAGHVRVQRRAADGLGRLVVDAPGAAEREVCRAAACRRRGVGVLAGPRRPEPALGALGAEVGLGRRVGRAPRVAARPGARPSRRAPASSSSVADRLLGACRTRPRRSACSGPGPSRRSGTSPASTGCPRRSRSRSRCPARRGSAAARAIASRDVAGVLLERELGRVHADDHQPVVAVPLVPRAQVRQRAHAVDARVGPEVDQHDLAAQLAQRERRRAC